MLKALARFARNTLSRNAVSKNVNLRNPGWLKTWGADLIVADRGTVRDPVQYNIWVNRCVGEWQRIAQMPLVQVDAEGNEKSAQGNVALLLETPNGNATISELVEEIVLDFGMCGEWFIQKDRARNPTNLWRRDPARITLLDGDYDPMTGSVIRWRYRTDRGAWYMIPGDEMIHCRFFNPYKPMRGLSPYDAASLSAETDQSARKHNKYMLDRHGRVQGVVTFADVIGDDELKRRYEMWQEKIEGSSNAGKWQFLDGNAKVEQLSQTMLEMDWQGGARLTREEICAAYRVPPMVVGIHDKSTYSNYESALLSLYQDTLMPLSNKVAGTLARGIGLRASELKFTFDHIAVLQASELQRVDRYTALVTQGKVSPEQAAEITGLNIGDIGEVQKTVWVSMSDVPASMAFERPASEGGDGEGGEDGEEQDGEDIEQAREAVKAICAKAELERVEKATIAKAARAKRDEVVAASVDRQALPFERKLRVELRGFFAAQADQIMQGVDRAVRRAHKESATKATASPKTANEIASEILGKTDWNKRIRKTVQPILSAAAEYGATKWLAEVGMVADKFRDEAVYQFLRSQLVLFEKVNANTMEALTAVMGDLPTMISDGKSVEEIMAVIEPKLEFTTNQSAVRAQRIARTESMRSINGGRYAEMVDVGVKWKRWLAIADDRVRDSHAEMNGVAIAIGDDFAPNLAYPGDPRANPAETINCRCTVVAEMDAPSDDAVGA